ncbi:DoxX family membrane protein [Mucilaginibacter segetis]|uniref:DoxX family membrane protein n=1 Tax=Mucilaginibacter segetis TaxID=2793071 RepID=A0A934UMZ6_9SPHI|nr:DoxX family membrane protein [Mucilaginibacter segetis]MBK0379899.1 DoxX family membrane protein [Mucilaginibacter segetis]
MKIAVIVVRTLMGLLFLFASITYLFKLMPVPPMEGGVKTFNEGLAAAVYLMPLVKVIELIGGFLLLIGRYNTLVAVVLFPIIINIVLFHAYLSPSGLPAGLFLLLGDLFLAYYYRKNYISLFAAK